MNIEAPQGEPIDAARFDTRCMRCSFDLSGLPIILEKHYGMAVVKCPECGGVQPYGPRFRTIRSEYRRAQTRGCLWLLMLIVLIGATGGALAGLAQSTGFAASVPFAYHISEQYERKAARPRRSIFEWVDLDWWEQERATIIGSESWLSLADWIVLTDLLYYIPICFVAAMFWRAVLHRSRLLPRILILAVGPILGAIGLQVYFLVTPSLSASGSNYAIYLAEDIVGRPIGWLSYVVGVITFAICYMLCGPLLRVLVSQFGPAGLKVWYEGQRSTNDASSPRTHNSEPC